MNESGANSENNLGIPIAYKWDMSPFSKYKSFSRKGSPDLDEKLKKYIKTSFMKGLAGAFFDSLILMNSKKDLSAENLKTIKLRGVVCSENKASPGTDDRDSLEAMCTTTLATMK